MEAVQDAAVDSVSRTANTCFGSGELTFPQAMHGVQQRKYNSRISALDGHKSLTLKSQATSLPLLLLESLGNTGTLKQLMRDGESIDEVLNRGRVSMIYFLGRSCGG
jgi:hypothetical protein